MKPMEDLLAASAALHRHLCPRQVLGVRMGMWAGMLLGLDLPQEDKRLLTVVETDGCFADGVSVATNCWVGRRTLRVEDYGKAAATFVDMRVGRAVRLVPRPAVRARAWEFAPEAQGRWRAMLLGYQRMPAEELLAAQWVQLVQPVERIVSSPGKRAVCGRCGEKILNEREVLRGGWALCRSCAEGAYYREVEGAAGQPTMAGAAIRVGA